MQLSRLRLFLACLILGPFAPWIALLGKLRRRGLVAPGWWLVLAAVFIAVHAVLWGAPLRWEWVSGLYLALCGVSGFAFMRSRALRRFQPPRPLQDAGVPTLPAWRESLAAGALVVYPALFGYGLMSDMDHLRQFAIHLPASVYTEALAFAFFYGTPSAALLALWLRLAGLRPGIRLVLNLYGGALAVLAWIALWSRVQQFSLRFFGTGISSFLFSDIDRDASFRAWTRGIFFAGGAFLGAGYLAPAPRTAVFLRRALFLSLPALLGYANLMLLLGEGGPFLAGLREHLYREGRYGAYRVVGKIEVARLPRALHVPFLMRDLADLEYLRGSVAESRRWRKRILETTAGKPFFSVLRDQVAWEEKQSSLRPGCVPSDSLRLLYVPRVHPAATLDANWYALLSAVAYFHPEWSDFDLKKKLLEVSPDVQLSVPALGGVPAVAEVLDVFGLPFSPCFLDSLRLHAALRQRKIPFLSYEGQWVPVVGWDPCRRGFLCYRYPDSLERNPWLNPADQEALFGNGRGHGPSDTGKGRIPYNLIALLPESDVLRHLHDIGGVALVLGDSAFASAAERKAAYLVEYGDVLYQEHDDNEGAAGAYARAQSLHPSDYAVARMAYLERRARWEEGSDDGLDAVFRGEVRRRGIDTGLKPGERDRIAGRITRGEMGQYLLVNWHESTLRFFAGHDSAARDSSREVFRTWMRLQPHNPVALDSLASGFEAQGRWDSAAAYYRRMMEYYPLGNEVTAYQLAWALFHDGKFKEMDKWLGRCPSLREEARALTMRGASAWNSGHRRAARAALEKSLKLDKTAPEAHAWMVELAVADGDSAAADLHRRWRKRTK